MSISTADTNVFKYAISEVIVKDGLTVFIPHIYLPDDASGQDKLYYLYYDREGIIWYGLPTEVEGMIRFGYYCRKSAENLIDSHLRAELEKEVMHSKATIYQPPFSGK